MIEVFLDLMIYEVRGKGLYRNRQIQSGVHNIGRKIQGIITAHQNRAKGVSNCNDYVAVRYPYNILTEEIYE